MAAIACEPKYDTVRFYKIISDALESELITWSEIIPQIARYMGSFDQNQAKFFSNIKDENIKLNFFNEIKESAEFKSTGLINWINSHKELNLSIDYLFDKIYDDDCNIELFNYCLSKNHNNDKLLPKALEYGKYFCTKFHSLFSAKKRIDFYIKFVFNFIKLNDSKILRILIEFLLDDDEAKLKNSWGRRGKDKTKKWDAISSHSGSSILIPCIFDVIEQISSKESKLIIETNILTSIFMLMSNLDKEEIFSSPKKYYNLLFHRLCLSQIWFPSDMRNVITKKLLIKKIVQFGDEITCKSLMSQCLRHIDWLNAMRSCQQFTTSFCNMFCDI